MKLNNLSSVGSQRIAAKIVSISRYETPEFQDGYLQGSRTPHPCTSRACCEHRSRTESGPPQGSVFPAHDANGSAVPEIKVIKRQGHFSHTPLGRGVHPMAVANIDGYMHAAECDNVAGYQSSRV